MPRSLTLSFELLETFVTLIRHHGEAAAVMRELELNQPTLSKRLRHLQHKGALLDRPWLVREGKTWKPTTEGQKVLPAVEDLVDRHRNLERFVELGGRPSGSDSIHFACGQEMAAGLVRRALRAFRRKHPDARLRISTLRGRARIEGVSNGSIDLAVVSNDAADILEISRRPLHIEPLATHRLALVCASGTKWDSKVRSLPRAGAPPEALCSFPLVLPEPDSAIRKSLDQVMRSRGLLDKLDIAVEIGGWGTILEYVRDGFGVGVAIDVALTSTDSLTIRKLDSAVFFPVEFKLICRRLAGTADEFDLSEQAMAWRTTLEQLARA